MKKSKMLQIKG